MGGSSSKSSVQITNEFFNKTINQFISDNSQKVDASGIFTTNLVARNIKQRGCNIKAAQTIDAKVTATGKLEQKDQTELKETLKNAAATAIDNSAAQKNGFLSTSIANNTEARTNLKNKVTNIIENTMESTTVQEIFAKMNAKATMDFTGLDVECYEWQCKMDPNLCTYTMDQNIKADIVARGISAKLTEALTQTIKENTTDNTIKQSSTQLNAGLDEITGQLFGFLGAYKWVAIASVVAICCIVLVMVGGVTFLGQTDAGQNAIRKGANVAANVAAARAGKF